MQPGTTRDDEQGITVRGIGRVRVRPDAATLTLGVETQARSADAAQADASSRITAILRALSRLAIPDDHITTSGVALAPTYDYSAARPRMTGYQATQTLDVRVLELAGLGPLIDAAVEAGATQVHGVAFSLVDPGPATDEARRLAVAEARRHAEVLAEAAGVRVGRPQRIAEGGAPSAPPVVFEKMAMMASDAGSTPVSTGTLEVVIEVDVRYSLG